MQAYIVYFVCWGQCRRVNLIAIKPANNWTPIIYLIETLQFISQQYVFLKQVIVVHLRQQISQLLMTEYY